MSTVKTPYATVLIAEDDNDNRFIMKTLLELRGYHVVEAADGQQAINLAESEQPDLILMDLRMPQLNGLSATRYLRQHPEPILRNVPIIALSAFDPSQHRAVALAAGCNDYILKPINYDRLEQLIESFLQRISI